MEHRLPTRPSSGTEMYLAAILAEIQGLRADMQAQTAPPVTAVPEIIELREPSPSPTFSPLPDGFPGREALEAAGITSLEAVPRDGDALVRIKGIGRVTAGQILVELAQ